MEIVWTRAQRVELDAARRQDPTPHVRIKALALWNLGDGHTTVDVARWVGVTRHTVLSWRRRYAAEGLAGLGVRTGRGRRSGVDAAEVRRVMEQSPRAFGLAQERWTLSALRRIVPSLRPLRSLSSVHAVLHRLRLVPKRGQYRRHSPDPDYVKKKSTRNGVSSKRGRTQSGL